MCACGERNNGKHAVICKLGGYIHLRNNNLQDTTAELFRSNCTCEDVETEPGLIPVFGELLCPGTTMEEDAKLDVCTRNLWTPLAKSFADIRVLPLTHHITLIILFFKPCTEYMKWNCSQSILQMSFILRRLPLRLLYSVCLVAWVQQQWCSTKESWRTLPINHCRDTVTMCCSLDVASDLTYCSRRALYH